MISHHNKQIMNVLTDKDLSCIKEKYTILLKMGNIYQTGISSIKAISTPEEARLNANFDTYYSNLNKFKTPSFDNTKEYIAAAIASNDINYKTL